jgi:WWE domain/Right handed beta helix region
VDGVCVENKGECNEVVHSVPILFPCDKSDGASATTFEEACLLAAESHRPLHLRQNIDSLNSTITLRKRQHLIIQARPPSQSIPSLSISGNLHSLFLLNNSSHLTLEHVHLHHQATNEDCRQVGAAINLRYKATATLRHCHITSNAGFCGWAVQKSSLHLEDCVLWAPLRSALVCFGQATLQATSCCIEKAGVHGVCARGECQIHIQDSQISDSTVRGLYAYANAMVVLEGTTISGTIRPDMAAIEVWSGNENDEIVDRDTQNKTQNQQKQETIKRSSLTMTNCQVVNNAGAGIKIRGNVLCNDVEEKNILQGNLGGNVIHAGESETNLSVGARGLDRRPNDFGRPLRDDEFASSFRQGDWWCPHCNNPKRAIPATKDCCSCCLAKKNMGVLLTADEVVALNRGVWVDSTAKAKRPTWWFHGEKEENDWIQYDEESTRQLEQAFQRFRHTFSLDSDESRSGRDTLEEKKESIPISYEMVSLMNGKYQVHFCNMQQINVKTMFPRLVRRQGT